MDLYQIFTEHNRPWSPLEIFCFFSILFVLLIIFACCCRFTKMKKSQALAGLLLFSYFWIVLEATVLTRTSQEYHAYQLEVFWSWKDIIVNHDREMLKEDLLNMILLFPFGLLLPFFFHRKLHWWQSLLIGLCISGCIEGLQLILCRGLFEFDDMIHNSFGCMIGSILAGWIFQFIRYLMTHNRR